MATQVNSTIENAYWVQPGIFLAGGYPAGIGEEQTRLRLRWLLDQGLSCIVDLTEAGEAGLLPYTNLLQEEVASRSLAVTYHRLPIPDYSIPTCAEMHHILEVLRTAISSGQVVYLHCHGGAGRTGTVVGCYLREQGLTGSTALAEIARLRLGLPEGEKPSPETEAQRSMVVNWEGRD